MSLPINVKFEAPKHKAPAPTRVPLFPPLTPVPPGAGRKSGDQGEAGRGGRPITAEGLASSYKAAVAGRSGRPPTPAARRTLVKLALPAIPLFALALLLGVGCSTQKPATPTSAMDVGTAGGTVAPAAPAPAPKPQQATSVNQPTAAAAPAAAAQPPATPSGKPAVKADAARPVPPAPAVQTYVVQKGDTLFKIAKTHYGDGNKWQRIAAANPGVNSGTLKVGQAITVPAL